MSTSSTFANDDLPTNLALAFATICKRTDTRATPPAQKPFPLLKLPAEIRLAIYAYLVPVPFLIYLVSQPGHFSILLTCRLVNTEARALFFYHVSKTLFLLPSVSPGNSYGDSIAMQKAPSTIGHYVRCLHFEVTDIGTTVEGSWYMTYRGLLNFFCTTFPLIDTLSLTSYRTIPGRSDTSYTWAMLLCYLTLASERVPRSKEILVVHRWSETDAEKGDWEIHRHEWLVGDGTPQWCLKYPLIGHYFHQDGYALLVMERRPKKTKPFASISTER